MDNSSQAASLSEIRTARISQRQSKACQECTRLKIRCDKQIPCGRCTRLSKACSRKVVRISKAETIHRDEIEFLARLRDDLLSSRDIDKALASLRERMAVLTHGPGHQTSSQANGTPSSLETSSNTVSESSTTNGGFDEPLSQLDGNSPITTETPGSQLSSNSESSHTSNLQRIELLAWGRHSGNCFPHINCPCRSVRVYSEIASINADLDWPGLRRTTAILPSHIPLPSTPKARKLIQFHVKNILWHHNVFHAPTFLAQCEEFWATGTVVHSLWLSLYIAAILVSVWTALNSGSLWSDGELDPSLPLQLFQAMVQTLYSENFCESLSIYSIQAIVLSTRVAHNLDQSNLNATLVGAAIRIAHNLGLHKIESDPKICIDTQEGWFRTIETEVGRRCWNQLVIQDYFQIPFTGTYVIHPWHYTTSLPINCHDVDMVVREEETPTINSYPRTLSRIASLMPRLMDGLGPAAAPYTLADVARHVAKSDQDMTKVMRDVPRFLLVQTENESDSFSWLPAARHSLALSAADKIIMIHRPILYHSFQLPALARTRTTCVAAAMAIFRAYEYISQELTVPIWTHSAFCVTAAMVIGLELLFRESHVDDEARHLRAAMTTAAQRLRSQKSDVIAERGAALIDTVLGVEEDLVIKLMRLTHSGDLSLKSAQRDIVNSMIADNTIMAKFLALSPTVDSNFSLVTGGFNVDDWLGDATEWFRDGEPGFLNSFDMVYPYTNVD